MPGANKVAQSSKCSAALHKCLQNNLTKTKADKNMASAYESRVGWTLARSIHIQLNKNKVNTKYKNT